jgi:hypothetical protein
MRHFIAYHNREKMGEHSRPCQVYTNKPIHDLTGSVVWIVEGVGRSPKRYNLLGWFTVREVTESPDSKFSTALRGIEPGFEEHVRLNEFEWFPDFRRRMGNFAFGLQPIVDDKIVSHLKEIAAYAGQALE